ncbi:G-D-S-L family lipolytic protein [Tolypothrix sp. NIES-4075]|uniref:SGNH/GDSL hydrolase family protein n=1 Tax=Tolypothrix sp. NIES-4075 TaxID=2005459 RepID=UPI000B5C325B|nr:SGNH/GDSL hydrolase family protein [Tolypothrix sp. NIES-4075]GAX43739.1 G-D-S-L family lipolytic protein [Tolypothrix sp. NIES-4075]
MTKLNRWVKLALTGVLILSGLLVGLGIVEIGLRIAGIEYKTFYTVDEHRGWVLRPLVSGWYRSEGESYVQINSDGFRDREHTLVKPENTLRIALLGDSFVEALQVPLEKGFAAVIERTLSDCPAKAVQKVEVINFGVSGYGTAQELITLREKVWDYSPDIVLLAFFTGNDLTDNSRTIFEKKGLDKKVLDKVHLFKPYFELKDDRLVLDESYVNTDTYRSALSWWNQAYIKIEDRSRILQVLHHGQSVFERLLNQSLKSVAKLPIEEQDLKFIFDRDIYKPPTDPDRQQAWQVTEKIISLMHNEVIAKKADFAVVTLSDNAPAHPDPSVRQEYMQALGVADLFYPEKRIKDLGEREGFSVLNLGPTFQAYAEQNHVCLHGFDNAVPCGGHWNALGHQLAGKMIASKLCEKFPSIATNQVQ